MKKLMTLLFLFVTVLTWAQNFEGTIKWSMKMDVTDPKLKAEMAEGQQKMNDPATQAKMKEMQAKMNDPQFKAMMENNPQMKAMMEKMMKGNGSDMMSNMIPKGMTIKVKDGNSLVTMEGGMGGEFLHTKDGQSTKLDRENKTYTKFPEGKSGGMPGEDVKPTVTKTSETAKILSYNCTKYVVTMSTRGQSITQNIWATTEIKDLDVKAFSKQRMGRGQSIFYEGIDGIPLKIESLNKEGNMVMEVTDIKKESLNAADFTIPSDYKEVKMMGMGR